MPDGGTPEHGAGIGTGGLEDPRAPWEQDVEDPAAPRALLAVMFTDIVGSTELATAFGDKRWRELLEQHDVAIREQIARFEGREVDTAGDAFFATFGRPIQAVDCALESARAVRRLGLRIRAGIHMGECVVTADKVRGVTVHIGARVGAKAKGDEVLVSGTVRDTLVGQGLTFEDRGEQTLKGVEGRWRLFAVEPRVRDNEADLPPLLETHIPAPPPPAWKKPRVLVAAAVAVALLAGAIGYVVTRGGGLSNVPADSLAAIDSGSGAVTESFPVGRRPVGVAAARDGVWVTNSIDRTVSHVASDGGAVRRSGVLGSGPSEIAIGPTAVWVANIDGRSISRIDPRTATEIEGDRLQAGNGLSGITYGAGAIWITNAIDGTVWQIDEKTGAKVREIIVGPALRDVAADQQAIWVASETAGTVTKISPTSGAIVDVVNVGNGARAVAIGAGAVWVANAFDGTVSRIDANGSVTNTIAVGNGPRSLAIAKGKVFVANEGDSTVSIVDAGSRRVIQTIRLGNAPMSLATAGDRVWVSVRGGTLSYRGGTLRFGTAFPAESMDPARGWSQFGFAMVPATHDGLTGFKKVGGVEGGVVLPNLAEEMLPPTDDGKTYSVTLRRGLRYSDGSPVRASDVRKSFERQYLMDAPALVFYGAIKGTDACSPERCDLSEGIVTDDAARTVTFHLRQAEPDFFYHLAFPTAAIVPSTMPMKDAGYTAVPGTGPYRMAKVTGDNSGGEVQMERNPHFRSRGPVQPEGFPDRIVVRWGGTPEGVVESVKRGDVDFTIDAQELGEDTAKLLNEVPAQVHIFDGLTVFYAGLNPNIPPMDDVRVRRALNFAVDRRAMGAFLASAQYGGTTCQVLAKNLLGYRPYCPYTTDPSESGTWSGPDLATARRLISDAGARGKTITIWVPEDAPTRPAGEAIAAAARSIGLRAVIRNPDEFPFERQFDPKAFQVIISGWFADYPAPSNFILPLLACPSLIIELTGLQEAPANLAHFCDRRIDAITLRAIAEQQRDPLKSAELWAEVDRAYVDTAAWIPFASFRTLTLVSARVGNVLSNPSHGPILSQMWLTDRK
jgi:peptide/nickel transport system substrate-binding protein